MKKTKRIAALILAGTMVLGSTSTAFAAQWQKNNTGWWWQEDNGSWPANSWKWINGKCYYFNGSGYMLANTTTPDGYTVNADGAWTVNGVIQTQNVSVTTNVQYPLTGMTTQFGLNYSGVEGWQNTNTYNIANGSYLPSSGKYNYTNYGFGSLYAFACALSGDAYQGDMFGRTDPITVIAEANNVSYAEAQQMVTIVRDFLNSFDWKNADDMTKARKAAELVTNGANYNAATGSGYLRNVLLKKTGGCNDFASAYQIVTRLMGMDSLHVVYGATHQWNYVKINGEWKKFDGSAIAKHHVNISFDNIPSTEVDSLIAVGTMDANIKNVLGLN